MRKVLANTTPLYISDAVKAYVLDAAGERI